MDQEPRARVCLVPSPRREAEPLRSFCAREPRFGAPRLKLQRDGGTEPAAERPPVIRRGRRGATCCERDEGAEETEADAPAAPVLRVRRRAARGHRVLQPRGRYRCFSRCLRGPIPSFPPRPALT